MILTQDTVAKIIFTLTIGSYEGEVIEVVKDVEPFVFVYGKGVMLQSFENKLEGLKIGEDFKFVLPKEEAYGVYLPEMQIELDKKIITDQIGDPEMIEEELVLDNYIPMQDAEGNNLNGRITFIDDKIVKLDFNHPLADMDLYFVGKVLDLRPANAQEIKDGRVFEPTNWQESGPNDPQTCGI